MLLPPGPAAAGFGPDGFFLWIAPCFAKMARFWADGIFLGVPDRF
jgi:hypothetical protein